MEMSAGGKKALLQAFEGCKLKAYKCPAGIWTIGYGHTSAAGNPEVEDDLVITQAEADTVLSNDLHKFETGVESLLKVSVEQHQFDVLVDFAYNAGLGNLKNSGILRQTNASAFDKVPDELMKWTKGGGKVLPGLVRRCQARVSWWNTGANDLEQTEKSRTSPDDVSAPKGMAKSKQGNAAIVTTALGGLGAVKAAAEQAQDASDTFTQVQGLLSNTHFDIMICVVLLGAAIWYWRNQHMQDTGL